jgi:SAM-dependent methyltransferase
VRASLKPRLAEVAKAYREIKYPFLVVDEARQAAGRQGEADFTYGNTTPALVLRILELASATQDDVFYDLGCGLGLPAIVAALVCRKAVGVEILPALVRHARRVAKALRLENVRFIESDFGSVDVSAATIVYSYSTCFTAENRAALAACAARARPGARVLTVTHELSHPALELRKKRELRFEGSRRTVCLHVRV